MIGGGVFCLATGWLWLGAEVPARIGFVRQLVLTAVMLLVTAYSQFRISAGDGGRSGAGGWRGGDGIARRIRGGWTSSGCTRLSERLEGLVLLCGLGVVFVLSRESQWPETGKPKTDRIVRP